MGRFVRRVPMDRLIAHDLTLRPPTTINATLNADDSHGTPGTALASVFG